VIDTQHIYSTRYIERDLCDNHAVDLTPINLIYVPYIMHVSCKFVVKNLLPMEYRRHGRC